MFTVVAHKNLAGAAGYFSEHLAQNDYYAADESRPGEWIGVGSARLGLPKTVSREAFVAQDGKSSQAPLHPLFEPQSWLGEDQRTALLHVLQSGDRITGLRGLAGSGKTTVLREPRAMRCGSSRSTRRSPLEP